MILSMTGFGEAQAHENGVSFRAEIRSVNNRYFKSSIKVPEQFQRYETEIDKLLRSALGRGTVTYTLRMNDESPATALRINTALLAQYVEQLREVAAREETTRIDLAGLLEVPGVCQPPELDEAWLEEKFRVIQRLTTEAVGQLIEMRRVEGRALLEDMQTHLAAIRSRLGEVQERSPRVVEHYQEKLRARVGELMGSAELELDADALAREVAVFADRSDVNEEIARLRSHLDQFAELCQAPEETGRKLDFLAQEMLREANTIGSKGNDAQIARQVVEIKAAIDRLKEQVQNVE